MPVYMVRKGAAGRYVTNGRLEKYRAATGEIPRNTLVVISGGTVSAATSKAFHGVTQTRCTAQTAGAVWILRGGV